MHSHNHDFKVGDRVRSIGIHSKGYGAGKITAIKLNVATVTFIHDGRTESFNTKMLTKA
jgi:hypothetical protein